MGSVGQVQITFTGLKDVDKVLAELPESIQKKGLRAATRAVAKHTLSVAKEYVPHDTGALESSLVVKAGRRSRKHKHTVTTTVQTRDGMFAGDQFYGGFLEFGTVERKTKSGHRTGKIEENRWWFLRPALYSFEALKLQIFQTHLLQWFHGLKAKS